MVVYRASIIDTLSEKSEGYLYSISYLDITCFVIFLKIKKNDVTF